MMPDEMSGPVVFLMTSGALVVTITQFHVLIAGIRHDARGDD